MLTARVETADRVAGFDADDHLPKPVELDELLARLRRTSAGTGTAPLRTLRLGE
ncbi:hypothetical protein [Amycolatopsis sp. NBC_01307]|uniref:hypothetical protein n=1 Tax=Amycolatopsis sp. NBC_01307 TaxID=2903561 RepID=UPI003FA3D7F4